MGYSDVVLGGAIDLTINNGKTINKNHSDIGCIINDNSFHIFILENGATVDLGIHDDYESAFNTAGKYLCSKSTIQT